MLVRFFHLQKQTDLSDELYLKKIIMFVRAKLRSVLTKIKIQPAVRNPGAPYNDNDNDMLRNDDKRNIIREKFRQIEDRLPRNAVDEFIHVLGGVQAVAEVMKFSPVCASLSYKSC